MQHKNKEVFMTGRRLNFIEILILIVAIFVIVAIAIEKGIL
mgnify:FL=1